MYDICLFWQNIQWFLWLETSSTHTALRLEENCTQSISVHCILDCELTSDSKFSTIPLIENNISWSIISTTCCDIFFPRLTSSTTTYDRRLESLVLDQCFPHTSWLSQCELARIPRPGRGSWAGTKSAKPSNATSFLALPMRKYVRLATTHVDLFILDSSNDDKYRRVGPNDHRAYAGRGGNTQFSVLPARMGLSNILVLAYHAWARNGDIQGVQYFLPLHISPCSSAAPWARTALYNSFESSFTDN